MSNNTKILTTEEYLFRIKRELDSFVQIRKKWKEKLNELKGKLDNNPNVQEIFNELKKIIESDTNLKEITKNIDYNFDNKTDLTKEIKEIKQNIEETINLIDIKNIEDLKELLFGLINGTNVTVEIEEDFVEKIKKELQTLSNNNVDASKSLIKSYKINKEREKERQKKERQEKQRQEKADKEISKLITRLETSKGDALSYLILIVLLVFVGFSIYFFNQKMEPLSIILSAFIFLLLVGVSLNLYQRYMAIVSKQEKIEEFKGLMHVLDPEKRKSLVQQYLQKNILENK